MNAFEEGEREPGFCSMKGGSAARHFDEGSKSRHGGTGGLRLDRFKHHNPR
jgi:hypothetical protein